MIAQALAALAIVIQNQAPLQAAPRDSATKQAVLWQGDTVEIRGTKMDYLQVYDHRRERAGYVKATQVRVISLEAAQAPELLSVVRFLRDTPGAEALGMSYAAAYLKAVPSEDLTAEPLDALGVMADRLAHRASTNQVKANEAALAAHLEVVAQLGVAMNSFEVEGSIRVCYDGDMFLRVMMMPTADAGQRARAALGLTRPECVDPDMGPDERYQQNLWQADVLDRAPLEGLTEEYREHLHIRRAAVWAAVAFTQSRRGESAQAAGQRALQELALVDKTALNDNDLVEYNEAAVRVGASRWAAQPPAKPAGKVWVQTVPGAPGETCVLLQDAGHDAQHPLLQRCTYATVWTASANSNPTGTMLALAVQPLDAWRELWLFRESPAGWTVNIIPPGTGNTDLGYLEFAGWVPGTQRILTVREVKVDGRIKRRFEIMSLTSLAVEHQATTPEYLSTFMRWQEPRWKHLTVALR
ncbi:MAG: hypothetical protein ABI616_04725 [Pseudomonadota bacterium]